MRRVLAAAGAALLLGALPEAQGQFFDRGLFNRGGDTPRTPTEDEIGVPVPVTGRVQALKGHEIQFEIRAEAKTPGASVEFLIRDFPSAGRIVSLVGKPMERNKAIVTYYADPDSGATSDAFSFAVRYRGGRYSAAMRYDIDLEEHRAEIEATGAIEFGEVSVGSEEIRDLVVRNNGNGPFSTKVELPPPWHLVEPADGTLSLGPGSTRRLRVAFRPELTGETSYYLGFSRSAEGTTRLSGTGGEPFALSAEEVELRLDPDSRERRGEVEVVNRGSKALTVEVQASNRLQSSLLESYFLAPDNPVRVRMHLGPTDTAPFDGMVQFVLGNGYAKSLHVFSPVVPGEVKVEVPGSISSEVIHFGQVEAGSVAERSLTITNVGGVSVPLEFHIPEPFRLLTEPGPQLAPLASVDVTLAMQPGSSRRGMVDTTMAVHANGQSASVRLLGSVVRPAGAASEGEADERGRAVAPGRLRMTASPKSTTDPGAAPPEDSPPRGAEAEASVGARGGAAADPAGAEPPGRGEGGEGAAPATRGDLSEPWYLRLDPEAVEAMRSPLGFVTRPLVERDISSELRPPEDLAVVEAATKALTLGWTAPRDSEEHSFAVEVRENRLDSDSGQTVSFWVPYERVRFNRIDRLVKARLAGLEPYRPYEFRVFTVAPDGRSSPPSEAMVGQTEAPGDWTWIAMILAAALAGTLAVWVWRIVREGPAAAPEEAGGTADGDEPPAPAPASAFEPGGGAEAGTGPSARV